MATLDPTKALELLKKQLTDGHKHNPMDRRNEVSRSRWSQTTAEIIRHSFAPGNGNLTAFLNVGMADSLKSTDDPFYELHTRVDAHRRQLGVLGSCIDQLELALSSTNPEVKLDTRNVFIVHGRDEGARESVARFLEKVELKAVVLQDMPNKGLTIIEKFEEYTDVGFAVVLLTGDDVGGLKDCDHDSFKLRARQNVILELGFFLGKLGRHKVCALYQPGVEIPSDFQGVVFVELDAGDGWRHKLLTGSDKTQIFYRASRWRMRKQMTLAAKVAQASTITPRRS